LVPKDEIVDEVDLLRQLEEDPGSGVLNEVRAGDVDVVDGLIRPQARTVVPEEGGVLHGETARLGDLQTTGDRRVVEALAVVLHREEPLNEEAVRKVRAESHESGPRERDIPHSRICRTHEET